MSIIRIAVENHLANTRLNIRELLETAYYAKYGKPIPVKALDEDERRWNEGENENAYLYDFEFGTGS